jgi:holo-[acyl-carrier protein] synthase
MRLERTAAALRLNPECFAIGVDAVFVPQFRRRLEHGRQRFLERVLLAAEITACEGRVESLAARFAAKEAATKALGTGVRGVGWHDLEIRCNAAGAPALILHGQARARAASLGFEHFALSLSHDGEYAFAVVVAGQRPRPL